MEFSIALAVRGRNRPAPIRPAGLGSPAASSELLHRGPRRLAGVFVLLLALAAPAGAQVGFDRPGGDYANIAVRSGDPAACASRCERDPRCRSWSFSYPTGGPSQAICWRKRQVTPLRPKSCRVSGGESARGAAPPPPAHAFSNEPG